MQKAINILVIGASRGIGRAVVELAAKNTAMHIVAASRTKHSEELPDNVQWHALDLNDSSAIKNFAATIMRTYTRIDCLLYNSGTLINKGLEDISMVEVAEMFQVNIFGAFQLIQMLLPLLKAAPAGAHIVTIGSMGGVNGTSKFPGLAAYSASKAALGVLSECLAEELKPHHITVNCLALGAVQTEMLQAAFPDFKPEMDAFTMAQYILWFMLNGKNYFNGKILPVATTTP